MNVSKNLKIAELVCKILDVESESVFQKNSKREVVDARIIICKIIFMNLPEEIKKKEEAVASFINKDRCTVIHYLKVHENLMDGYPKYRAYFTACMLAYDAIELPIIRFDLIEIYNNVPQL